MGFRFHLWSAIFIAAVVGAASSVHAQVRVITGDIEHIYGPGGEVWDDNALRARNERAERGRKIENIRRQAKRRQDETDAEYRRSQAEYDQAVSELNERIERSQSKKGSH